MSDKIGSRGFLGRGRDMVRVRPMTQTHEDTQALFDRAMASNKRMQRVALGILFAVLGTLGTNIFFQARQASRDAEDCAADINGIEHDGSRGTLAMTGLTFNQKEPLKTLDLMASMGLKYAHAQLRCHGDDERKRLESAWTRAYSPLQDALKLWVAQAGTQFCGKHVFTGDAPGAGGSLGDLPPYVHSSIDIRGGDPPAPTGGYQPGVTGGVE